MNNESASKIVQMDRKMDKEVEVKVEKSEEKERNSSESSNSESYVVVVGGDNPENNKTLTSPVLEYIASENDLEDAAISNPNMIHSPSTPNVVGKSIFYDCLNDPISSLNENSSCQKSDTEDGKLYIVQ